MESLRESEKRWAGKDASSVLLGAGPDVKSTVGDGGPHIAMISVVLFLLHPHTRLTIAIDWLSNNIIHKCISVHYL